MSRKHNTDVNGKKFSKAIRNMVWNKAAYAAGHPPDIWRKDAFGNIINWQDFGNRDSKYGWEIDHIVPISNGGTDNIHNLQPLHWETNKEKGDQHPWP